MIEVQGLYKRFGDNVLFENFNLSIAKGEIVGLIGESGCGKSTLARMIAAIEPADKGKIYTDGREVVYKKHDFKTQYVFQSAVNSLNPALTIEKLVMEAPVYHKICEKTQRTEYFYELMDMVHLDKEYAGRYPRQLSGGQQQRVALIRALAVRPDNLLLDEITSAQDKTSNEILCSGIKEYCEKNGASALFISHDMRGKNRIFDKEIVL